MINLKSLLSEQVSKRDVDLAWRSVKELYHHGIKGDPPAWQHQDVEKHMKIVSKFFEKLDKISS